jgi:hypothetical protein
MNRVDTIREVISVRAQERGLTAYAIGKATDIDPDTVRRYLTGRCALNSRYVSAICSLLELELRPMEK